MKSNNEDVISISNENAALAMCLEMEIINNK